MASRASRETSGVLHRNQRAVLHPLGNFLFAASVLNPSVPKEPPLRIPLDFDESLALAMQVKPMKKPAKPAKAAKTKKKSEK